jgi:hypothetical protein
LNGPLLILKDRSLGEKFRLHVEEKPRRFVEQRYFEVHAVDRLGNRSETPLFAGIYSAGRKASDIKGWVDGNYYDRVLFSSQDTLDLSIESLDVVFFKQLGLLIPPGGSFMVAYVMIWVKAAFIEKLRELWIWQFP